MPSDLTRRRVELTREELYELIWSEAMTKIAARFQISDVALKKRCIKHRIPVPGRGYWRRVETGASPKRIALPKVENAAPIVFDIKPAVEENDRVSGVDQAFLDFEAAHPIIVGTGISRPHEVTQAVSRDLKGQNPDDYGAIRSRMHDTFQVRLHPSSKGRVIAIVDALAKACRDRGFAIQDGKPGNRYYGHAAVIVDGIELRPVLDERMRRVPYRMTAEEIARQRRGGYVYARTYSYEPTGELTLKIEGTYGASIQTSWKDTRHQALETRLNEVMIALRAIANQRLDDAQKAAERQRRFELVQQERADLRERIARERSAVDALEVDANKWTRAQHMRAYIAAVERRCVDQGDLEGRQDWIDWAKQQADRLDPLTPSPPSILDTPERDYAEIGIWQMKDEN